MTKAQDRFDSAEEQNVINETNGAAFSEPSKPSSTVGWPGSGLSTTN
jgi:hypothetical protein